MVATKSDLSLSALYSLVRSLMVSTDTSEGVGLIRETSKTIMLVSVPICKVCLLVLFGTDRISVMICAGKFSGRFSVAVLVDIVWFCVFAVYRFESVTPVIWAAAGDQRSISPEADITATPSVVLSTTACIFCCSTSMCSKFSTLYTDPANDWDRVENDALSVSFIDHMRFPRLLLVSSFPLKFPPSIKNPGPQRVITPLVHPSGSSVRVWTSPFGNAR